MSEALDIDAYLARIGHDGARSPEPEVLAPIVARHAEAIPFENIDAFLGRRVSLDPAQVADKLIRQRRGGWCFEQNLLLGDALRALGFDVTDLAGRVLWNREVGAITPRSHRALLVRSGGRRWLVDVGFGGHTLTGMLDLDVHEPQATPHEPFRLVPLGAEYRLESLIRGAWMPLFRFDLQPQQPVDYEAVNFQLTQDPRSHFTQMLIASRTAPRQRHVLRDGELVVHTVDAASMSRQLDGVQAIEALREVFGIGLDDELAAALRRRFARPAA